MVDMRLLKVIIISISFFALTPTVSVAGSSTPQETKGPLLELPYPTWFGENEAASMTQFAFRYTQFMRFRLKKDEKKEHESAVFFMLDNVPDGEIVSWYSDKRDANGKVRAIHSYPISGGYCRTYQAYIKLNGAERHMTNNACKRITGNSWTFYK
jgi:hypothetical protein